MVRSPLSVEPRLGPAFLLPSVQTLSTGPSTPCVTETWGCSDVGSVRPFSKRKLDFVEKNSFRVLCALSQSVRGTHMEVSVLASLFDEMSSEHAQQSVVSMVSTEDLYWVERLCCEAEENEDDASRRLEAAYLSHLREGLRSEQKQMESAMRHRHRAC